MTETREINLDLLLEPPLTLRMTMDDEKLHDLAESIKLYGVLQNLVVVPASDLPAEFAGALLVTESTVSPLDAVRYEIVAGHRRYLAARLAGLVTVPCKIYEKLEDGKYAVMLAENGFREEVTAAEEGVFFLELAEKQGRSEPQLCNHLHS